MTLRRLLSTLLLVALLLATAVSSVYASGSADTDGQVLSEMDESSSPSLDSTPTSPPAENPVPVIQGLIPSSVASKTASLVLTVNGLDFSPNSVIEWSGVARPTTGSGTQLQTTLSAADLVKAGNRSVTVFSPEPGGGTSGAMTFIVVTAEIATPTFTAPRSLTYVSASSYTVKWAEENAKFVTGRSLVLQRGRKNLTGGCAASWTSVWTRRVASGYTAGRLSTDHCYRFVVRLTNRDDVVRRAISAPLYRYRRWTGGINLYRSGVFLSQPDNRTCAPTVVKMTLNVMRRSSSSVFGLYDLGRRHQTYYPYPGLDPDGELYTLRVYGGSGFRINNSASFTSAIKAAAKSIATSRRPTTLYVNAGNHVWMMNGFTATANPLLTNNFVVTGVNVTGPYYFGHPMAGGYDHAPNVYLSLTQLRGYFTPYNDHGLRNRWYGHFVTVNGS
jgi:hypothetical protein